MPLDSSVVDSLSSLKIRPVTTGGWALVRASGRLVQRFRTLKGAMDAGAKRDAVYEPVAWDPKDPGPAKGGER